MNNPYPYSDDNKRYTTWNYYLRHRFSSKVAKIPLNAGFTCPNRDGTCGVGGCVFCNSKGASDTTLASSVHLLEQYEQGCKVMEHKWQRCLTIPYFQAYTNTYGTLDQIKSMMELFMEKEEVVAIALATRADCLPQDIVDYLDACSHKKEIWMELGLQTVHDEIAHAMNRGHTYRQFVEGFQRLRKTGCKICVHLINGLPNETRTQMIENVQILNELKPDAVKLHMLQICHDSRLGQQYLKKPWDVMTRDEYVDLVVEQITYLDPSIILQRLTGDALKEELIEPTWSMKKTIVLNEIDKKMARENLMQGCNRHSI